MPVESIIPAGRKWTQRYDVRNSAGGAYDLSGCSVAARVFIGSSAWDISAGIVNPPTDGIILLEWDTAALNLPLAAIAQVVVVVTQGAETLLWGEFTAQTSTDGAKAVVVPAPSE